MSLRSDALSSPAAMRAPYHCCEIFQPSDSVSDSAPVASPAIGLATTSQTSKFSTRKANIVSSTLATLNGSRRFPQVESAPRQGAQHGGHCEKDELQPRCAHEKEHQSVDGGLGAECITENQG